jgi:regulatory protein YycH of two-component signal transduction system YycFG
VAKYRRIPDIIRYQSWLIREYRRAFDRFKNDPNISPDEIKYLESVYAYLVKQSLRNLEELTMIITAKQLRMSDDERIQSIDRIYFDIENKLSFLRHFNNSTQVLIAQRAKENSEVGAMKKLYEVE